MLHEDQRFKHIRVGVNPPRIGKDYNEMLLHVAEGSKPLPPCMCGVLAVVSFISIYLHEFF